MLQLTDICPDCQTSLAAPSGPQRCETCWRIVQLTRRTAFGGWEAIDAWGRLTPKLQKIDGVVRALANAYWLGTPV